MTGADGWPTAPKAIGLAISATAQERRDTNSFSHRDPATIGVRVAISIATCAARTLNQVST